MINKDIKKELSVVFTRPEYPSFPYEDSSDLYISLLNLLEGLGLNRNNPFVDYIKPNQTVVIKPNWVRDQNPLGYGLESLVTHTSLIKYIIDFLATAMDGRGKIIIGDAPLQNCNFENLKKLSKIDIVVKDAKEKYPGLEIIVEDWRLTVMKNYNLGQTMVFENQKIEKENPYKNYTIFDTGKDSFLEEISNYSDKFRVTKYKPSLMMSHHKPGKHEYLITNRVFEADFFINMPKMKTHIKAGLTGALKNLVGINGHKEFLPHHIKGSAEEGGDNYMLSNWFKRRYEDLNDYFWENINNFSIAKRKLLMRSIRIILKLSDFFGGDGIIAGSWKGNKTIWRTTLDLNHILYFYSEKPTKILNIVDGIVAGEGEGPLEPTPKKAGILIAGENPAIVDMAVAKILGYSLTEIPTVFNAISNKKSKFYVEGYDNIEVNLFDKVLEKTKISKLKSMEFIRPKYWSKKRYEIKN